MSELKAKVSELQTMFDIHYSKREDQGLPKWQSFKIWQKDYINNTSFIEELNKIGNRARYYDRDVRAEELAYAQQLARGD